MAGNQPRPFGPPTLHTLMKPFYFTMCNFTHHLQQNPAGCWFSPFFYTSPTGYKMCIGVDANGSGLTDQDQEVVGRYMSVYVHLMPGNYDDHLWWPFRGEVKITLKNNNTIRADYDRVIRFTDKAEGWAGERVVMCERSRLGWGDPSFITHDELCEYLENDCIRFEVEVTLS